jgi:uncharacterized protein (TIRG00374 family)
MSFVYIIRDWPSGDQWAKILARNNLAGICILSISVVAAMFLRAIRWGYLSKDRFSFFWSKLILIFGWSFMLMAFSPLRTGDFARVWWVQRQGGSASTAIGTLVVERMADLFVLLLYLCLLIGWTQKIPASISKMGLLFLLGTLLVYLVVSFFSGHLEKWIHNRYLDNNSNPDGEGLFIKIISKTQNFLKGISCLGQLKTNLMVLVFTMASWAAMAFGVYHYLKSFFPGIHWSSAVAILTIVNLAGLIRITPGNVGVYEMAAIMALKPFGISSVDALVTAVGLHFTVLLVFLIYGLGCRIKLGASGQRFWELV